MLPAASSRSRCALCAARKEGARAVGLKPSGLIVPEGHSMGGLLQPVSRAAHTQAARCLCLSAGMSVCRLSTIADPTLCCSAAERSYLYWAIIHCVHSSNWVRTKGTEWFRSGSPVRRQSHCCSKVGPSSGMLQLVSQSGGKQWWWVGRWVGGWVG